MRVFLALTVFERGARALSSVGEPLLRLPGAAARRLLLRQLEERHRSLVADGRKADARVVRKELNALKRATDADSDPVRVATFFEFAPVSDPRAAAAALRAALDATKFAMGSVVVAPEGLNGALAVPDGCEAALEAALVEAAVFSAAPRLNWAAAVSRMSPFIRLRVTTKPYALTDGLAVPLALSAHSPSEMAPAAWHEALRAPRAASIIDVRNANESNVGRFDFSLALNTSTFADTWPALELALAGRPRNEPVLMYCTGGVRCAKAGAYARERLGFADVRSLRGGIVAYEKWLSDEAPQAESRFRGENFVFDRRRRHGPPSDDASDADASDVDAAAGAGSDAAGR